MILILEQTTGHVHYFHTAAPERSGAPDGMARLLSIGGRIVEQLDSRESKTGTQEWFYTNWRVDVPDALAYEIQDGKFDGLRVTAPIPKPL